jgi:hypothetical protein
MEIAEVDTAEATNFLREYFPFTLMARLPSQLSAQTAHIIAQARVEVATANMRVLVFSVPHSQYFFPRKLHCHGA